MFMTKKQRLAFDKQLNILLSERIKSLAAALYNEKYSVPSTRLDLAVDFMLYVVCHTEVMFVLSLMEQQGTTDVFYVYEKRSKK